MIINKTKTTPVVLISEKKLYASIRYPEQRDDGREFRGIGEEETVCLLSSVKAIAATGLAAFTIRDAP